jgi:hypothetical protein
MGGIKTSIQTDIEKRGGKNRKSKEKAPFFVLQDSANESQKVAHMTILSSNSKCGRAHPSHKDNDKKQRWKITGRNRVTPSSKNDTMETTKGRPLHSIQERTYKG